MINGEVCPNPPGASNYTNGLFNKLWYEIGKIQTKGGAFFERDCVCTNIDVQFASTNNIGSNATVNNVCNKLTPDGQKLIAISEIIPINNTKETGKFNEIFINPKEPGIVNYNVIFMSDEYAVEYDCGQSGNTINYCFHILSTTPTMPQSEVENILQLVDEYNLNPQNLPYKQTNQTGCKYLHS